MVQARTAGRPARAARQPGPASRPVDTDRLRERIAGLLLEAASFVAPGRVEETARGWLAHAEPGFGDAGEQMLLVADALGMATDLALFTPSASGATAFDRLARRRSAMGVDEAAALDALRRAQFRLMRVEGPSSDGVARLRDLVTEERLSVLDESIGTEAVGVALVARLAPVGDGRYLWVGGTTPLDEAGLAVAQGFVRPGARGLLPQRCAEAVYRHVLRHGTLEIPGLNRPPEGWNDGLDAEMGELDLLALRWAEPGAAHDPEDVQFIRAQVSLDAVLDVLGSAASTREHGLPTLSDAYAAIALVQMETLHRRAAAGSGTTGLDTVGAALEAGIAAGELPPGTRGVFEEVRRRLGTAPSGSGPKDSAWTG